MARGLYGCLEGNEKRNGSECFQDHLTENWIAEGEWMEAMISAAKRSRRAGMPEALRDMARLRDSMKAQAVRAGCDSFLAQERADSVLRQAMSHLRI